MAPKLGRLVNYLKELQPIKSHVVLNTWSCKILWQIIKISPLSPYLWPPYLTGWWHIMRSSWSKSHMILQSCGLVRLAGKFTVMVMFINIRYNCPFQENSKKGFLWITSVHLNFRHWNFSYRRKPRLRKYLLHHHLQIFIQGRVMLKQCLFFSNLC